MSWEIDLPQIVDNIVVKFYYVHLVKIDGRTLSKMVSEDKKELLKRVLMGMLESCVKLNRISEELLANACSDISHSAWSVLATIHRHNGLLTIPQIAEQNFISRQAVQRQITILLKSDYIETRENPHNKRSPFYALTEGGWELFYRIVDDVYDPWLMKLMQNYDEADLQSVLKVFSKITEQISD